MALRVSSTASTSNYIRVGTSPGLLDAQGAFSMALVFRLNANTATYNFLCGRGGGGAISGRNWAILCDSGSGAGGSTNRLRFAWVRSSTDEGGDSDSNGALTVGRWHHLVFTFNGSNQIRCYLNGVLCYNATVTGNPNNNSSNFQFGDDSIATGTGGPCDFSECEVTSSVLSQDDVTDLFNDFNPATGAGGLLRIRDIGGGKTISSYWDMLGNETNPTDKAGSLNATSSGVTLPSSTHLDHPPMAEPICKFNAATGLFDATSGGSAVANNGAIARWEDQSGRKLHLTQSTSAQRPHLRNGTGDYFPSVFFDKFDSSWVPQFTSMTIDGVRLNPLAFTVECVYSGRGWRSDLNGTSANNPGSFNTLFSVDGNSTPSTRLLIGADAGGSEHSTGVIRYANATNTGTVPAKGSDGTTSGHLFVPTSPSFLVYSSDGTDIFVGVNDLSSNNTAVRAQVLAAANTSGGIVVGTNPANANFGFDGAFYHLAFYNRAITSIERETRRDYYAGTGLTVTDPAELWFGIGSSSDWGQEAAYGRDLYYYLWNNSPLARRCWIYDYGSPRARFDTDVTYTNVTTCTVPAHNTHAVDTIDIVENNFATKPVRLWTWGGINDIANGRTAAQALADLETYLTNRRTAIGASRIRQSTVFTVWINNDMAGAELTERTAFNNSLFTDADFGTLWTDVVDFSTTVLNDMTTAGVTYTSDSKHPNETAFSQIIGPLGKATLPSGGDRIRNRNGQARSR